MTEQDQRRREECERKARRGEMDSRLEFTFQLLIDHTGLSRNSVMDYVFESNMLDQINELFLPHGRSKLMWFYQDVEVEDSDSFEMIQVKPSNSNRSIQRRPSLVSKPKKKKLFLTDGWEVGLTGICIYIIRLSTAKQLPEEGFHKDLICGTLDAEKKGLVKSIARTIEYVFIPALAIPQTGDEPSEDQPDCPLIKSQLLPELRSFCSCLKVCEEVCDQPNIFADEMSLLSKVPSYKEAKQLATNRDEILILEKRVTNWIRKIREILLEDEKLQYESDTSGPQDELEYWKKRGAQFSQIAANLSWDEVIMTICCLQLSRSRMVDRWRRTDNHLTLCYNEAKDNSKYIQALEKCCHSLYLDNPVKMRNSLVRMLQTVRLIHDVSMFYNTTEKISSLMVKITNQMIESCKLHITNRNKDTIWSQDRSVLTTKLNECITLNKLYHNTYERVKYHHGAGRQFSFSENYVFGKFDAFCDRLIKVLTVFDTVDDYNGLFERRMEGLLFGEALDNAVRTFDEAKLVVMNKGYDYLDQKNREFDHDYVTFFVMVQTLKDDLAHTIETNFSSVWETGQGIKFLDKFEKIATKIPVTRMDLKYSRVLKYCEGQIDRTLKLFKKRKGNPPVPRNFPPLSGRIVWVRSLRQRLSYLMEEATDHPVLKVMPEMTDVQKKFSAMSVALLNYEEEIKSIWMNHNVKVIEYCLVQPILKFKNTTNMVYVNFDPRLSLLILESSCMLKMELQVPIVTKALFFKKDHFTLVCDTLQCMLNKMRKVASSINLDVRPLFVTQLVWLLDLLTPGLQKIDWTDSEWKSFVEKTNCAIDKFQVLVVRIHDVYNNRILQVLSSMQLITLHTFPEDGSTWTAEEFLDKIDETCRQASMELNQKSTLVEEAVEEVLTLVQKANESVTIPKLEHEISDKDKNDGDITKQEGKPSEAQPDWSTVCEFFDNPFVLAAYELPPTVYTLANSAVKEMRRYYSRKVIDVLIKITRLSIDALRKKFSQEQGENPIFEVQAILMVPSIVIRPDINELQDIMVQAGKLMVGVSRGVGQWSGNKKTKSVPATVPTIDDARAKRRRLYKLTSEKKPPFPVMHRNFYSHVTENKEIIKALSLLSTCVQPLKPMLFEFLSLWTPYKILWNNDLSERRDLSTVSLLDSEAYLQKHHELLESLKMKPDIYEFGSCVIVSVEKLKYGLTIEVKSCNRRIGQLLRKKYHREMDYVYAVMNEMERKLERSIRDLDDIRMVIETLKKIRENEVDMELKIEPIEEAFNVLTRYDLPVDREDLELVDNVRYCWQRVLSRAMDMNIYLLESQPQLQKELADNLKHFKLDCVQYCHEYRTLGPMMPGLTPREASDRLIMFQNRFDGMWRRLQSYQSGEELFGLETTEYPELVQIRKELNLLQKLYKLYNDVIDRVSSYYDIPWGDVNIEQINNELMEFQNRCRKLPKGLKEWPAFHALKRTIDDFNDMCPLLELMANKAMKQRHWQRIMQITSYNFELESEGFCLKNILEAPLLKHKEDIEDICISAMKEKDIEAKLRQVTNEWSVQELTFLTFNNRGELLLRGDTTAETIGQLEDSLMILGSLMSNRYNAPFRKQIQQWVYDLSNTNEILERWLLVQNMWVYLEAVFVGGDIAKQLPKEAKRFSKIDKSWQKIMQRAHETPSVVICCVGDDMLKQLLPHLQEQLELCQKSLSGYLERKRTMFPRFFFVSDPALLEILGQASDSHTIQNHLLSIFDNTKAVKFHEIEYNKMTAIISTEGEFIPLERAVRAEGSVETWLTSLLQTSQQTIHSIIRSANHQINDNNFTLLPFLEKMAAQIGILGIQMIWTRDSEVALIHARTDRKQMHDTNNRFLELLNTLIDQTTRDLTRIERIKFETLITIHVHQRDIFDILCRLNVRSVNDFEWLKQCRFYFKEDLDKTWISITDVNFNYQNEYLGCTERLVITPLTDRCYITLAQALAMSMGSSPCGPAGTGKTETVKDMAKTLAKYVVVFNCSDQMDYRGLGRIYKGLAQSGTWGCFDEFNRIELPVLSVAAQQIAVVLSAKKEKKKQFTFTDGDIIDLCPEFGIFITMNPGYAGRKELPENLKIQFRTVAMMVPDRQIIIRVKLASCGFLENITLARKFYTLYKLCEEQLTKQVHYDFGLRNILSVLRTLGAAKRVNSKDSESTIVMRVLRDMNLSKLIDEDEPLFLSLVTDLFPNQVLEKTAYPELEEAIASQVEEEGLIYHSPWVLKLIQLYETQRVRHGIMTLGPTGSGKTCCIQILMKALTICGESHREMRMNPKAITAAQMFGRLDVATNDWTDGIFSALWRKTLKLKKGENVWLVLDGPVDSIWIENLNSVLDDNKTLTLANGDRLPMAPCCKIIFEPHNIDNASPATVSRNGMVYMSSSGLDWCPVLAAWLKKRNKRESKLFKRLFEMTFSTIYTWASQNLNMTMKVLQCNTIQQMLVLLQGLIPKKPDEEDGREEEEIEDDDTHSSEEGDGTENYYLQPDNLLPSKIHLQRLYMFSLVWGLGALLETMDRHKFHSYINDNFASIIDLPKLNDQPDATVFDFFVTDEGKWEHWNVAMASATQTESSSSDYSQVLVPILESVRITYLINIIATQEHPVLLIGEQGSGKTVMMKSYMRSAKPELYLSRSFNFSSATSPFQFQKTIESYVEKRLGNTFGPPGGLKMTVFIDDINLPEVNEWGDQITNEIVRQTMDMKGFYSLEKPGEFSTLSDILFVGAMVHPGGGRNDIPSRLKRQFCIFNCTMPSDASIDKIFRVVGETHYNAKRGFSVEIRNLVKKLTPITRELWHLTRMNLLPTPAKFHYVFSLRDLSRIWQGMVGTLSTVIDSSKTLVMLWRHETTRVFSDRFTSLNDKSWFDKELRNVVETRLGTQYISMLDVDPPFVDFMRDAPEPTGEEGEEADMELPKVYEPVLEESQLRERLEMFLSQFNEMVRGVGMDLVFFPDAILHLVKISRVIRHPRGNVMLVGVGGSGKQSLTRLASFIAGYKTFQIALTRSYNITNFLEDLKLLYRTCGVQAKGTTFIFTDLDIKEEGFLEYLNNILSSGGITNLFTKDEQSEIISELTPIMKRENSKRTLNHEIIMDYFLTRTCQNLHVVFCFSPVGEKFRNRALRFPALVSGCTIDWFQPWPKDALIQVAEHFLVDFDIECTVEVKQELVGAMGTIQDIVDHTSSDYYQRFRRATHVTPKSYLNFIGGYKSIYHQKQKELGEGAHRMDTGLAKLEEASISVELLKKDLDVMEQDLAYASQKAETVLVEVTDRARQAEIVKNQVMKVKVKAEALVESIAKEKAIAEEKLEAARPALEEAESALNTIKPAHIATVRKLGRPPHLIMRIMDCVLILFKRKLHPVISDTTVRCPKPSWPESLKMMASTTFLLQLQNYPKDTITSEMVELLQLYFNMEDYNMDTAKRVCGDVAGLLSWTKAMAFFHSINKEVLPLKANLTLQEARLSIAMDDLSKAELQLHEREVALNEVKSQYDAAVQEKQRLTDAANVCLRKMTSATALINGLGGEKIRWTQQSKEFKKQLGRYCL
uniref:Dynein heavy chain 5, axonemal n=1 Tax=Sipha flava TaxID=143950 RepID=A0A2S2PXW6_9HEMI